MVTPPFELNDPIVSEIERFVTISGKCFETFKNKSRIVFVLEPAPISFNFEPLFLGERFLVLFSKLFDVGDFVTDGLGHDIVFDRNASIHLRHGNNMIV